MSLDSQSIPVDVLLNCILVKERIRPAMLIQPQDYQEATGKDPKIKRIIESVKKLFPELLQSEHYNVYQGILISYDNFNGEHISLEDMGKILGYPCYAEFETLNRDEITYHLGVKAVLENDELAHLIANVCANNNKLPEFEAIAKAAEIVFKKEEYQHLLTQKVKSVIVTSTEIVTTKSIINKIINKKKLSDADKGEIQNILYNFSFTMDFQFFFDDNFQYNNPVHMGILLSLLLNEQNDTLSPFYPLQFRPENRMVNLIIESWQENLMDVILRTKKVTKASIKTRKRRNSA
jgi:hypothetical protein